MKKNMGNMDRVLRLVISAVLVLLYFNDIVVGTVGIVLVAIAAVFTFTSVLGFCPLYRIFGLKTSSKT